MLLVVVSHRQVQYKASNLSLKICHFHRIFAPFVMTVALFDRKLHLIWIILNTVPNIKRQYWRFERKNSKLCACHLTDFFGRDKLISRVGKFTTSCIRIYIMKLDCREPLICLAYLLGSRGRECRLPSRRHRRMRRWWSKSRWRWPPPASRSSSGWERCRATQGSTCCCKSKITTDFGERLQVTVRKIILNKEFL